MPLIWLDGFLLFCLLYFVSFSVPDVTIALITIVLVIVLTTIALGCYRRRSQERSAGAGLKAELYGGKAQSGAVTYSMLEDEDA